MTSEPRPASPRRAWLRGSLSTFGSLLIVRGVQACKHVDEGQAEDSRDGGQAQIAAGAAAARGTPRASQTSSVAAAGASPTSPGAVSLGRDAGTPKTTNAARAPGSAHDLQDDAGAQPSAAARASAQMRLACPVITQFEPIVDDGPRSSFTVMADGDQLQWLITGTSAALYATQLPDQILFMLKALDRVRVGYPLSMLQHSLQAATRARRANATDDLVLCALCHHLGSVITLEGQAELSASIVRGFVAEDAYHMLRHQDEYRLAHYGERVDLPTGLRARWASAPWDAQAKQFYDEWDRPSYDPSYDTLPLSEFEGLVRSKFSPDIGNLTGSPTQMDCLDRSGS